MFQEKTFGPLEYYLGTFENFWGKWKVACPSKANAGKSETVGIVPKGNVDEKRKEVEGRNISQSNAIWSIIAKRTRKMRGISINQT